MRDGLKIPLYQKVREEIRWRLQDEEWQVGERLPSEDEFCRQFQVSKVTVRQAISQLVREGLLLRKQGKGTFVLRHHEPQMPVQIAQFSQRTFERGEARHRLLGCRFVEAPRTIVRFLGYQVREPFLYIERLGIVGDTPRSFERGYIPALLLPEKTDASEFYHEVFTVIAERLTRRAISETKMFLSPSVATEKEASALGIEKGIPVQIIERVHLGGSGEGLLMSKSVLVGQRFALHARV